MVNECGWSRLPTTRMVFPARIVGTIRSPAWAVRTSGPKKSEAATLIVGVVAASLARSSAVRTPSLPVVAARGMSSVIGRSTGP